MKKNIFLFISLIFLLSCGKQSLSVESKYPFVLSNLPFEQEISQGQTREIICNIEQKEKYTDTKYHLRIFQKIGKGLLFLEDGTILKSNIKYLLKNNKFKIYYKAESNTSTHSIDIFVEDNFKQQEKLSFTFQTKQETTPIIEKDTHKDEEIEELKRKITNLQNQINSLIIENESLKENNSNLSSKNKTLDEQQKRLQKQIEQYKTLIEELEKLKKNQKEKIDKLVAKEKEEQDKKEAEARRKEKEEEHREWFEDHIIKHGMYD